jgi:hypothetical protein
MKIPVTVHPVIFDLIMQVRPAVEVRNLRASGSSSSIMAVET